ncbi:MAG: pentapeptide repeat-containing protein [Rivularia sp. (in: cyanobacteria)]
MNLNGANLTEAKLEFVSFTNVNLKNTNLTKVKIDFIAINRNYEPIKNASRFLGRHFL